jgi:bifunctional non-homologous end joining protein LigD
MDSANLEYREGSSDKVYTAEIVPVAAGFVVNFAYGRRGNTMTTGTKTAQPVDYAKAKKIFDALIDSKLGKGYVNKSTPTTVYATYGGDKRAQSGYKPQLLCMIEESDLEKYFLDPAFFMMEKMDGERRMAKKLGADIFGVNKKGEIVPLPTKIISEMQKLPDCVLDGEQVGDILFVFDCLESEGVDVRGKSAEERYTLAQGLCSPTNAGIQVVKAYATEAGKRKEFAAIKARKGEGVVFKLRNSPYKAGRPNSGGAHLKFKFVATATCAVKQQNATKRSVALELPDKNEGDWVFVGNVTIPPNYQVPAVGTLVEVRYLYAFPNGGSLFQAVYLGPRPDQSAADDISTLKLKQGTDEEDN